MKAFFLSKETFLRDVFILSGIFRENGQEFAKEVTLSSFFHMKMVSVLDENLSFC